MNIYDFGASTESRLSIAQKRAEERPKNGDALAPTFYYIYEYLRDTLVLFLTSKSTLVKRR